MSMMSFMKDAGGLLKSIDVLTFLQAFCRASTVSAIYFQFKQETKDEWRKFSEKFFFDMNHNQRGRLPKKKRSMSSKEKQDNVSSTDMVVKPKESLLEMEE